MDAVISFGCAFIHLWVIAILGLQQINGFSGSVHVRSGVVSTIRSSDYRRVSPGKSSRAVSRISAARRSTGRATAAFKLN